MKIASHTLVRNGMPFIIPVLRQVLPYMNRCLITLSAKSVDGTREALTALQKEFPDKIYIDIEDVSKPADLTLERQKQLNKTTEDWVLFLDDDDYWDSQSLMEMVEIIDRLETVDALANNPYQVINKDTYDDSWRNRWFTKWFKNQPGVHYRNPWPRDLIYKNDEKLYWRNNANVFKVIPRYFHLSNIKPNSFRNEVGFESYTESIGEPKLFTPNHFLTIDEIYSYL